MQDRLDKQLELTKNGVRHAVVIGEGVIGASWAALFLANKITVTVKGLDPVN